MGNFEMLDGTESFLGESRLFQFFYVVLLPVSVIWVHLLSDDQFWEAFAHLAGASAILYCVESLNGITAKAVSAFVGIMSMFTLYPVFVLAGGDGSFALLVALCSQVLFLVVLLYIQRVVPYTRGGE